MREFIQSLHIGHHTLNHTGLNRFGDLTVVLWLDATYFQGPTVSCGSIFIEAYSVLKCVICNERRTDVTNLQASGKNLSEMLKAVG